MALGKRMADPLRCGLRSASDPHHLTTQPTGATAHGKPPAARPEPSPRPAGADSNQSQTLPLTATPRSRLRAADPIPAYRLSHDSRLPGHSLGRTWRWIVSTDLEQLPGLILDLRSESYAALGPAPERAFFPRVVTEEAGGTHRALNHFNKKAKGEFVRELLLAGIDHLNVDSLLAWAADRGIRLEPGKPGGLRLAV